MKLYNTPTKQVTELTPLKPPQVNMYVCGPTVYDYAHIGHWFTYIRTDTLIRTLKLSAFRPKVVMNITDVGHLVSDADDGEDKLEKGARREGKTAWDIAALYTQDFLDGMQRLHITAPDVMPKATDHITEQIALIKTLEEKGFTYQIDDGVYFDAAKFPTYAQFAHLDLADQKAGARVAINVQKRHPYDFALWKFSPSGHTRDMEWDSPWGKGFPGWHIECSAMSMKYLGETLDIHTGGVDHIPVHHTNEIAQSEAATDKQFVRQWMHSNHVLVNGEKISKSLGNGIRLKDVEDKGFDPLALRFLVLESHYRTQSTFSWETLTAAQARLNELRAWADLRHQPNSDSMPPKLDKLFKETRTEILSSLQNDLNTPRALAHLNELVSYMFSVPVPGQEGKHIDEILQFLDDAFGLGLSGRPDITSEQKEMITNREAARKNNDFTTADRLRDELQRAGLTVRDTPYGPQWARL